MSKTTKMLDDDIIKSLKCCLLEDCERCKKDWSCVSQWDCMRNLMRHTLNFINRLKAIICDKNILIDCLKNKIERQQAEIERLQEENKNHKSVIEAIEDTINPLPFETDFDKAIKTAKSEAIKEFAEKVDKILCLQIGPSKRAFWKINEDIKNLVKEMVGDDNA